MDQETVALFQQLHYQTAPELMPNALYPLTDKAFISIKGEDTNSFLQGQLSCDINLITKNKAGYGCQSNAKGRVIASFQVIRFSHEHILLMVEQDLAASALTGLKKYSIFSKVELTIEQNLCALGFHGPLAQQALEYAFHTFPVATNEQIKLDNGLLICTDQTSLAYHVITDSNQALSICKQSPQAILFHEQQHQFLQHHLGIAYINQSTVELFVAQMLNYQLIGAISFTKGCYTGQEIIARMKYLGKLKRRMYHLIVETRVDLKSADAVSIDAQSNPQGNIVSAIKGNNNQWDVLVVLTDKAFAQSSLFIGENQLLVKKHCTLPYAFDDE